MKQLFRWFLCGWFALAGLLVERSSARTPVVSTVDQAEKVVDLGGGRWFLDFGEAMFGTVEITADRVPAGSKVVLHFGEAAVGGKAVNRNPGGSVRYQRQEVELKVGKPVRPRLEWKPQGWMKPGVWISNPKESGETAPFRYLEIEQAPAGFAPDQVKRISWHVAFDETASRFQSSDPGLDAVWKLCKHSIKATSFLGVYVDGDRERTPYEADVLINQLSHYAVDAHYATARDSHEYLLDHPTWPTEWRLQSVILAWNDYLYSGDDASLRKHYVTLRGRVMAERRDAKGWFIGKNEGSIRDIVDWPAEERDGYEMGLPVKSVVTAFHYRALVLMERIAKLLGKSAEAREYAEMAAVTRKLFNETLWDEARGCYVDGMDPVSGRVSHHASTHANAFPLALGLVPEERVARVGEFLKPRGMACSVYGAQFLIDALYDAGLENEALALMNSNGKRSWRNMIESVGSTVTLEAWDPLFKPNLDWNHAWGAAAANLIARRTMGIEPLEAGFKRVRVRPQVGTLTEARYRHPSPKGPLDLMIRKSEENQWSAEIQVPTGMAVEFHVPTRKVESLRLSSGKPRVLREEGGRMVIGLLPGVHRLECVAE